MSVLILVPTEFEAELLRPRLACAGRDIDIEICGFGPVVSGIVASTLIARHQPAQVILAGIAGSLSVDISVGSAYRFSRVGMFGVGVGSGESSSSAAELGWHQLPSDVGDFVENDEIVLLGEARGQETLLLTCCSASASAEEGLWRRRRFPQAGAEDMEGFAVAVACQLADVPLTIVRGISNVAGDRRKNHWRVDEALASVADFVKKELP